MYRMYRELHGNDEPDDICWFAPSKTMNPKLPQSVIDKAMAEDSQRFGAEYLNKWREDLSDCFPLDAVEACTDWDCYERPPQHNTSYIAFCDAATGTGSDSFALCVVHRDPGTNIVIVDVLRERKPRFVAFNVIAEYAALLKQYGVSEVYGDRFARGIIADEFARNHITFRDSENVTSDNYLRTLPMVSARRVVLLNSVTLRSQLTSLERYVSDGHEGVRHPQIASAHDDVATACAGALVTAGSRFGYDRTYRGFADPDPVPMQQPEPIRANDEW
jgi:hypothetical protein